MAQGSPGPTFFLQAYAISGSQGLGLWGNECLSFLIISGVARTSSVFVRKLSVAGTFQVFFQFSVSCKINAFSPTPCRRGREQAGK
jgi:hypothetical protein